MPDNRKLGLSRRRSLQLTALTAVIPVAPQLAFASPAAAEVIVADRRDQLFDQDWRFFRGDGEHLSEPVFDDGGWRRLDLPHDWSIEDLTPDSAAVNAVSHEADTAPIWQDTKSGPRSIGPFDALLSAGGASTGYTVGGIGWYRKRFRLPALAANARVEIVFDGAYMNAEVWLNGQRLGARPYGYSPFAFDLTPHLDRSGENVIAIRVTNLGRNSRWYAGSGLYRHVRLNITRALRFRLWSVSVTTPSVSKDAATVQVRAELDGVVPGARLAARIRDASGRIVAEIRAPASAESVTTLRVAQPKLWSPAAPDLYQLECELLDGEGSTDRLTTSFGIRRIEIDAQSGLRINGQPYKLRGGCVHHDNGLLGAAAIDRAEERRVQLLKARGFNAIRTSHNPPSPGFLDACDRLGMLVLEEAFDCWNRAKNPDDYHLNFEGWWREDLAAMVRRDGNHPCVILWSIGNEIPEAAKPEGVATAKMVAGELRRLDPTRPITEAINGSKGPDVTGPGGLPDSAATQFLDLAGYNYAVSSYEPDHTRFPNRVMIGTESFPKEVDANWRLIEQRPYLIGDFVWAAMDYLGEAGSGKSWLTPNQFTYLAEFPWFNAFSGDLDLIGEQKPASLLRDVVWGVSPLEMAVQRPLPEGHEERTSPWGWRDELQSWTWPGAEGRVLNVQVYTRGERVELELNGRKIAEKTLTDADKSTASFPVSYEPGRLVATAFRGGRPIGRRSFETAGPAAALRVRIDRTKIAANRNDLAYATIEIVDGQGRLLPDAVAVVEVALSGPAELAALGNANPRGVASFRQPVAKSWHGRALAILRPTGPAGAAILEVRSMGLKGAVQQVMIG